MYTALDSTLAYRRREELAREVSLGRLSGSRDARRDRRRRWSLRLARMLRAPSVVDPEVGRAGSA